MLPNLGSLALRPAGITADMGLFEGFPQELIHEIYEHFLEDDDPLNVCEWVENYCATASWVCDDAMWKQACETLWRLSSDEKQRQFPDKTDEQIFKALCKNIKTDLPSADDRRLWFQGDAQFERRKYRFAKVSEWNVIDKNLRSAAQSLRVEDVKHLLERGADVNVNLDDFDGTPLIAVCARSPIRSERQRQMDVALMLLEHPDIDVNLRSKYGKTALHEAAEHNLFIVVEMLISKGADVNARTDLILSNNTVLNYAVRGTAYTKHEDVRRMVEFLLKKGANVFLENAEGRTPLSIATHGYGPHHTWPIRPIVAELLQQWMDAALEGRLEQDESGDLRLPADAPSSSTGQF